jgi:hypothetical protein
VLQKKGVSSGNGFREIVCLRIKKDTPLQLMYANKNEGEEKEG